MVSVNPEVLQALLPGELLSVVRKPRTSMMLLMAMIMGGMPGGGIPRVEEASGADPDVVLLVLSLSPAGRGRRRKCRWSRSLSHHRLLVMWVLLMRTGALLMLKLRRRRGRRLAENVLQRVRVVSRRVLMRTGIVLAVLYSRRRWLLFSSEIIVLMIMVVVVVVAVGMVLLRFVLIISQMVIGRRRRPLTVMVVRMGVAVMMIPALLLLVVLVRVDPSQLVIVQPRSLYRGQIIYKRRHSIRVLLFSPGPLSKQERRNHDRTKPT